VRIAKCALRSAVRANGLGTQELPEAVAHRAIRTAQFYLFTYLFEYPFRVFVTVNDPSARAEILM
jgi:hypothetical protein